MTKEKDRELSPAARIGDFSANIALAFVIAGIGLCVMIPMMCGLALIVWLFSLLG